VHLLHGLFAGEFFDDRSSRDGLLSFSSWHGQTLPVSTGRPPSTGHVSRHALWGAALLTRRRALGSNDQNLWMALGEVT